MKIADFSSAIAELPWVTYHFIGCRTMNCPGCWPNPVSLDLATGADLDACAKLVTDEPRSNAERERTQAARKASALTQLSAELPKEWRGRKR